MSERAIVDILTVILSVLAVLAGAYASIQAWLTQKRFKQITQERLATKINVEYEQEELDTNLIKIIVKLTNKGETNIKLTKFNIDAQDRTKEFQRSYETGDNLSSKFNGVGVPQKLHVIGFNNAKLLNLHNPPPYNLFKLFMPDEIYERYDQPLSDEDTRPLIDVRNIRENINSWAEEKLISLKALLNSQELTDTALRDFLFVDTINRELRGFQIFPERTLTQEIILEYEGSGILYLNVEMSSIRQTIRNTQALEEYKKLSAHIYRNKELSPNDEKQYLELLRMIANPATTEIHKHKQTFISFLPSSST
ncbi:MAG: hypothetical protein ACFFDI_27770 [Promethearchaeota archaeon]